MLNFFLKNPPDVDDLGTVLCSLSLPFLSCLVSAAAPVRPVLCFSGKRKGGVLPLLHLSAAASLHAV
jgi:hypothetical protein